MRIADHDIESFLEAYQSGLTEFDAEGSAAPWGTPGMMITDAFVGVLSTREEMAEGLAQSYPFYRQLGLVRVGHTLLRRDDITERLVRLRVRWHFFGENDEWLTDGDWEYTLRQDDDGLHVYVAISIDEAGKISDLARRKGIDLSGGSA